MIMKSYTNLEQSKKLAEILSPESADMYYCYGMDIHTKKWDYDTVPTIIDASNQIDIGDIPCWSLAALFGIIRETIGYTVYGVNNVYMSCDLGDKPWKLETEVYDNEVDVCYNMILKLQENNLL